MELSVIIPTFNSGKVIRRCLESILSQTFKDFEVLVMDGGSADATAEIVQSFGDKRVLLFSEPDKGIYDAMNKGIIASSGKWLYFLGSDDYLLGPDVFSRVFVPDNQVYDVLYGDVEASCLPPYFQGEWTMETISYNRCHQAIFYRKTVFEKLGHYDLRYKVYADMDMNLKWFFSPDLSSKYIPVTIAHYSEGGFSATHKDDVFLEDLSRKLLDLGRKRMNWEQKRFHAKRVAMNEKNILPKIKWWTLFLIWSVPFYLGRNNK